MDQNIAPICVDRRHVQISRTLSGWFYQSHLHCVPKNHEKISDKEERSSVRICRNQRRERRSYQGNVHHESDWRKNIGRIKAILKPVMLIICLWRNLISSSPTLFLIPNKLSRIHAYPRPYIPISYNVQWCSTALQSLHFENVLPSRKAIESRQFYEPRVVQIKSNEFDGRRTGRQYMALERES